MLIDVARAEGLLGRPDDPRRDDTVLDLSVGYDLAGIRSARGARLDRVDEGRAGRGRGRCAARSRTSSRASATSTSAPRLSDQVTLSTFHGCPADEIEAMAVFLMEEMGLHVTVKLNPTLLGKEAVDALLHDVLGYARDRDARGGLRARTCSGSRPWR